MQCLFPDLNLTDRQFPDCQFPDLDWNGTYSPTNHFPYLDTYLPIPRPTISPTSYANLPFPRPNILTVGNGLIIELSKSGVRTDLAPLVSELLAYIQQSEGASLIKHGSFIDLY